MRHLAFIAFCIAGCQNSAQVKATTPKIIAHRGASSERPENTLAAVEHAWERGADGVEIDVRLTADGVPIVFHDEDLLRLVNMPLVVAETPWDELRTIELGHGQTIPALAEVVETVPHGRVLMIEIKSPPSTVSAILAVVPDDQRFVFQSFDKNLLLDIQKQRPHAATYLTIGTERDHNNKPLAYEPALVEFVSSLGFTGVAVDYHGVSAAFLAAAKNARLEVDVWTVNDSAVLKRLASLGGVHWVETDDLVMAASVLGE